MWKGWPPCNFCAVQTSGKETRLDLSDSFCTVFFDFYSRSLVQLPFCFHLAGSTVCPQGRFSIIGLPFPPPPSAPHTSSLIKQFCVYLGINLWLWMETKPLVINGVFALAQPGSADVQPPEASSQHSARGRPGIMCPSIKLRAELLFSAKTIISTFPTIILIPSPITAVLPPSLAFHLIILPLITFADFVASAAHLCCKTILSSGVLGGR